MILSWIGESGSALAILKDLRAWLIERGEESELPMIGAPGLVLANCWHRDLKAAVWQAGEAFDSASRTNAKASRAFALNGLAAANAYLGNVEDARRQAIESVELLRRIDWHVNTEWRLAALGFLHLSQPAEADRVLRPMVSLVEQAGSGTVERTVRAG